MEHPSGDKPTDGQELEWSAYDLCEGWAIKRGFMTKKAARPDVARAANHLFWLALEGRISMYLRPHNYKAEESKWESHPDVAEITTIQALTQKDDSWLVEEDDGEEMEATGNDDDDEEEEDESEDDQVPAASTNKFALLEDDD